MLKSAAYFIISLFLFLLFSCVTGGKTPEIQPRGDDSVLPPVTVPETAPRLYIPETAVEFSKSVWVAISSVTTGILPDGRNATEIILTVENRSKEPVNLSSVLFPIEAVFSGAGGDLSYAPPEMPAVSNSAVSRVFIVPGTSYVHPVRFFHAADTTPAALVKDRVPVAVFMPESDRRYKVVRAALDVQAAIPACFYMARMLPYASVAEYMREHGIGVEATDRQGNTLLFQAVVYNNVSVVRGLLADGADVRAVALRNGAPVLPLHLAVLMANAPLAEELVRGGAVLNESAPGGESPAALAVRENNIKALRLLSSLGVPLGGLTLRRPDGTEIPARVFARDNKMTDIVNFLTRFE